MKERPLNAIMENPKDFKICSECYSYNWYENEVCVMCNSENFKKGIEIVKRSVKNEIKAHNQDELVENPKELIKNV